MGWVLEAGMVGTGLNAGMGTGATGQLGWDGRGGMGQGVWGWAMPHYLLALPGRSPGLGVPGGRRAGDSGSDGDVLSTA